MARIGKRLAAVFLAVAMVVMLIPVLGTQTAHAEGEISIHAFTLKTSSDFTVPQADTPITYPDIVSVATSDPAGIEADYKIKYAWYDNENARDYYQSSGDTGMFTPGEWTLLVFVEKPSDAYSIDTTEFLPDGSLYGVTFGGKSFYVGSINSDFIAYNTTFTIEDSGTAPIWIESSFTKSGFRGAAYSHQLKAYGGEPISYSVSSGTLPDGITLSSDGLLSGTFTAEGTYNCTINAVNAFGSASLPCTFTVSAAGKVIRSFTLQASPDFGEYYAGDSITYPDNVRVATSAPPEIKDSYSISYVWYDNEHAKSYNQSSGDSGMFTPGDWSLLVVVAKPSDDYTIDTTEFSPGGSLNQVSFGGVDFYAGSINSDFIGYSRVFTVDKVRIPTGRSLIYSGAEQTGVSPNVEYYTISGNKATETGKYTATLSLVDPTSYSWSDGTTTDKIIEWEIIPVKVSVPTGRSLTYNGKLQTGVTADPSFTISCNTGTNAGSYAATLALKDKTNYTWSDGTTADKEVKWTINKAANPLTMKPKTATIKYSKLKKKAQTLAVTKVISFTKDAKDNKTYTLSSAKKGKKSFKKYFKINKTTGKVTVKKGLKKGTYKVKVKVKAAGNANYKASKEKTVTFTVKVK